MTHFLIKKLIFLLFLSCSSFSCGIATLVRTEKQAFGTYNIISPDGHTFGNTRLKCNKKYHKRSELYYFLKKKGDPNFIYEYEKDNGEDGIILYYTEIDSAFVFEETDVINSKSSKKKNSRKIKDGEKAYLIPILSSK